MRDIRDDLKERLEIAEQNLRTSLEARAEADRQINAAGHAVKVLTALLELEASHTADAITPASTSAPSKPIVEFIVELLQKGPTSKEDIREYVTKANYFEAANAGRAVHAVMLNLVRSGRVRLLANGQYAETQPGLPEQSLLNGLKESATKVLGEIGRSTIGLI